MHSKKAGLIAAAAVVAMTALAGQAHAASVTYVGSDGNVWVTSPDGAVKKQVTTAGTPDAAFRSPTAKNDGTVAAIKAGFVNFFDPATGAQKDAWILPKTGAGSFVPYSGGQISPDGGLFAYDWRYFDCATNPCFGQQRVSFIAGPGVTNPCLLNCHGSYIRPRWVPGTPYAGMVAQNFAAIAVQKAGAATPVNWLVANNTAVEVISSFDISSTGRSLVETSAPGGGPSKLVLFANNGTPPDGSPQALCIADGFAGEQAFPRWSPDGSQIAWKGAEGIYVSPAPVANDGVCGLQPRLVAPGGSQPSWGLADAPAPPSGAGGKDPAKGSSQGAVSKCKKGKKKKGKKKKKSCRR